MVDNLSSSDEKNNYIEIIQFNGISQLLIKNFNEPAFELYLRELYRDLVRRSGTETKDSTISRLTFMESVSLPMIIAERLFYSFTNNRYAIEITKDQYIQGFIKLYSQDIDKKIDIICKIFDFDLNGIVNVDDITLIFAQFYVFGGDDMSTFNEIKEIIHKDLTPRKKMTISSFKEIMNNYNPDALYLFCFYLNLYCPFTEEQVSYFIDPKVGSGIKKDSPNSKGFSLNNSTKSREANHGVSLPDFKKKNYRKVVNAEQTYRLTTYFKKKYNILIEPEKNDYDNLRANKKSEKKGDECDNSDLNDLEMFEEDLSSAISKIDLPVNSSEGNHNITNSNTSITENSISRKSSDADTIANLSVKYPQYKTINTNTAQNGMISGTFLSPTPFMRFITKSPVKSPLSKYYKVKSQVPLGKNQKEVMPKYDNQNNNYEIRVNYYTRSGAVRDCKIMIIDDCLFVHIYTGVTYKFLKLINLKFTFVEEIEKCETLSNNSLFRIKLSSFINKNYKEMIFSSQDQLEMSSFLHKLQILTGHKELSDKYLKLKEIYRGSMSRLYLGKNIQTNEQVAIKQVNLNACDKKKSYETILWENDIMKFLQKTSHPNIVKTYDLYRTQDYFFFVIEYIPSGNLKNYLLENRSNFNYQELKTIMFQIASAVLFLHSHGIVHRDLKPENILVKKNEKNETEIKLIDFGFGRVLGRLDFVNEPYGTFYYASPEILNKTPYGFKTDIWSLGVIFFLILVGIHPFGESDKDLKIIQNNINNAIFKFPEGIKIEPKIKEIIQSSLTVDPKLRPKIEDIVKVLI